MVCPVLGNIAAPALVGLLGWKMLPIVLVGIAVELVLIKFIYRLDWPRAVKLGLLLNLASTLFGVVLMLPAIIFLVYAPYFWALYLLVCAAASAYIQCLTADLFTESMHDPFTFKGLFGINMIGIAIGAAGVWLV